MTVSQLTERQLVARVQQALPPAPPWVTVGIGDDAAVVETERNRLEVLTVDAIVDGVHFDRRFTPPTAIGHRALAVNLSDLAAMGAAPRLALLSFALPADLPLDDFDGIVAGIAALASAERLSIVGGNLTRTPGPLTIDVTALGTVKRRSVMTRAGARPGDLVYVTGVIGAAAAGLQMLQAGAHGAASCVDRYLHPVPRLKVGLLLGRNRAASACIDLSDGLADGAARIAGASGVGMSLDASLLPVDGEARAWFEAHQRDPLFMALTAGDDYELLFTVRPRMRGRLKAARLHGGVPITRIGVCTGDAALGMRVSADTASLPLPDGFTHFR
ncbi:MAG TPA: thiamine-phosphate kinase [Vicinamibacterales bacterium]|nr:thiamine-phosphate kinase [Vicinamibacterales bacterium]